MIRLNISQFDSLEFQTFFDSKRNLPEYTNYNWLGCSEYCENKARQGFAEKDLAAAMHWQSLAIDLMQYVQSLDEDFNRFSVFARIQRLRVNLLNMELAESKADSIRELGNDIEQFLKLNEVDFEALQGLGWAEVNKNELLVLRQIKNLLNVINSLNDNSELLEYPNIAEWNTRKDKLP